MTIGRVIKKCTVCGEVYMIKKEFNSSSEAYNWEQFMSPAGKDDMCKKCYKNKKSAERDAIIAAYDLGELTGSEKQIAWANNIREKFILEARKNVEIKDELLQMINAKTSAKWWIENRSLSSYKLIKKLFMQ